MANAILHVIEGRADGTEVEVPIGAHGGLVIEGVASGVAIPVSGTATVTPTASEVHLGEVGGKGVTITVTPTLTVAGAYSANDFVGTSATGMTFAGAARVNTGSGVIQSAVLVDYALQSAPCELWLFDVAPAGLPADNAAFTITDAAALTCIGVIPFSTYYASALNSVSYGLNMPIAFRCVGAAVKDIYGVLVTRSTPTYATGDLSVRLQISQD
jgi:hypothetical protein